MRPFLFVVLFLSQSLAVAAVDVPKAQFVSEFKAELPNSFCAENTYFRKCFKAPVEECKKAAVAATAACVAAEEASLPPVFHQPADGQNWGKKLGSCAGTKVEADFAKLKVDSAECKDPSKWR